MKRFAFLFLIVLGGTATADSYGGNGKNINHDCGKDPEAVVAGNENTIAFTGTCSRIAVMGNRNKLDIASVKALQVLGNENTVTVDAADAIDVPGNRNRVTWNKGLSGKRPKVSALGNGNKVGSAK